MKKKAKAPRGKKRKKKGPKKCSKPKLTDGVAALEAPALLRARDRRLEALAVLFEAVRLAAVAALGVRGGGARGAAADAEKARCSSDSSGCSGCSRPSSSSKAGLLRRARGRGDDGPPVLEGRDDLEANSHGARHEEGRGSAGAAGGAPVGTQQPAAAAGAPADASTGRRERQRRRGRRPRLRDLRPESVRIPVEDLLDRALPEVLVGLVVLAVGALAREL